MYSKLSLIIGGAVGVASLIALAIGASASGAVHGGGAARLAAPVVHETFTPLPCTGKSSARNTLQQEGCAEQQIVRSDATINRLAALIFGRLTNRSAQARFITAQHAWLTYRRADCLSVSDVFDGGSQAPVLDAQCAADRDAQHVKDLNLFLADLSGAH